MNDDQLLLLYYGEHDDPELARRVANDPVLSQRFALLGQHLEAIEAMAIPEPAADYGSRVWQQLAPQLTPPPSRSGWWTHWLTPRFSMAGAALVMVIAALAFSMGRQTAAPRIDAAALLASEVASHLSQTDVLLTGIANGDLSAPTGQWAQQLLLPNRLYRATARHQSDPRLAGLLLEIETLLMELSNAPDAVQTDGQTRHYINTELLMRVRMMRAALNQKPDQA